MLLLSHRLSGTGFADPDCTTFYLRFRLPWLDVGMGDRRC